LSSGETEVDNDQVSAGGTAIALWVLCRPRLIPYVWVLVGVGGAWAHWDRALTLRNGRALFGLTVAWTLLQVGTLWLNAAVDRDSGEVLFGDAVEPPEGTALFGYIALASAVAIALVADVGAGLVCAVCALLAVGYSHPRILWKGHPLGGPVVNLLGYGLLSPLAGWMVVDVPANPRTLVAWVLCATGVMGTFLAAQAFQGDEDRSRGYRTLVVTHGARFTIQASRGLLVGASLVAMSLVLAGWFPLLCLLGLPLVVELDTWMRRWAEQPSGGSEAWARGTAKRLMRMGAVGFALATVEYVRESVSGEPVAGLGTRSGHPADRPVLPPAQLRKWELSNAQALEYNAPTEAK
jgi:4-hydroxybenzoate polyprenyltransferase